MEQLQLYETLGGELKAVGNHKKANPMIRSVGIGPEDRRCKHCKHCFVKRYAGTYYKCAYRGDTNGPGTDHKANWPTCSKFEEAEQVVRTIGLYQPYATLMLHGKEETRWVLIGKKPPFPLGQYLIYSTKKKYHVDEFQAIAGEHAEAALQAISEDETKDLNGYAIGVGTLTRIEKMTMDTELHRKAFVEVRKTTAVIDTIVDGDMTIQTEPKEYQLWCLHFENVRRIKPFSFKGKQGVGFLKGEDQSKIEYV